MKIQNLTWGVMAALALVAAASLTVTAQQAVPVATTASAADAAPATARVAVAKGSTTRVLTNNAHIQGNALNSTNGPMNDVVVRLRDARFGRIVDTQLTDNSGLFAFNSLDPGTYIVEIMASDEESVLAASQLLNVNAGEAVSAIVKLPFRIPPFAGIVGSSSAAPSAAIVATQAVASSIAAIIPTAPVSPTQ